MGNPERAGTGNCERCMTPQVETYVFRNEVKVRDWRSNRTNGPWKVVVLRERLCRSCYENAVDKREE